jgi:predicted nucleic acid-binding protein
MSVVVVVADASPANILIRVGQIDVLPSLFGRVTVPTSVAAEMSRPQTPAAVRDWVARPPAWFVVAEPSVAINPTDQKHRGERDAIQLALDLSAPLLIDEAAPRRVAAKLGVAVIGTIGILERAADAGLIADLRSVHLAIRATDFRVDDAILDASLRRHLERRSTR